MVSQYILSGLYLPESSECEGGLFDESLTPVSDRFFTIPTVNDGRSLVATDSQGVLHSVGDEAILRTTPLRRLEKDPVELELLPDGIVKYSFFSDAEEWQKKLIEQVISLDNKKFIKTIPVTFRKKHLKPPEEHCSDEEQKWYKSFDDAKEYPGQLVPALQVVYLIFTKGILGKVDGDLEIVYEEGGEKRKAIYLKNCTSLEYASSVSGEKKTGNFDIFVLFPDTKPIKEGRCRLTIPAKRLNSSLLNWCSAFSTSGLQQTFEIKFSISSIIGQFDMHLLDPLSIEDGLMTQFPHRYAHLRQNVLHEPSSKPSETYAENAKALATWMARTEWMKAKYDLVTGYAESDKFARIGSLAKNANEFFSAVVYNSEEHKAIAERINAHIEIYTGVLDVKDKWDKYKNLLKTKAATASLRQVIDGGWVRKMFHSTRWREYLVKMLSEGKDGAAGLELISKSIDPKQALQLYKNGVPKPFSTLSDLMSGKEGAASKVVGKSIAALDIAFTVYKMANLLKERGELSKNYDLNNKRLLEGLSNYEKKFATYPSFDAITTLEALRRTADTANIDMDDKTRELINESVDLVLNAMVYVPVVGEVASIIMIAKAVGELAVNCATNIAKDLDSILLDNYFKAIFEYFQRLTDTSKEDAENLYGISQIIKSGRNGESLPVQFRVRAAVLTGLVRLVDRCGTRYKNPKDFEDKVKQYDIAGYIDTFILNYDSSQEISMSTSLPLDELWLYCYGCKTGVQIDTVFRQVGKVSRFIPLLDMGNTIMGKSKSVGPQKVKMNYQQSFPLHLMGAGDAHKLARTFCIDYSGIGKANVLFTAAYYYDGQDDSWHMLPGDKGIFPLVKVRIVVVLKPNPVEDGNQHDDLTGMPLSIKLVRTDGLNIDGPVYKGLTNELTETTDNGNDKGLLPAEMELLAPPPKDKPSGKQENEKSKLYGYVFHPFYFWDGKMQMGLKPFGFIDQTKPVMNLEFRIKAGNLDQPIKIDNKSSTEILLHLPIKQSFPYAPVMVNMITNNTFLGNKSSDSIFDECFSANANVQLSGYLLNKDNKWRFWHAGEHGTFGRKEAQLTSGYQFDFSWESPFEIIFLFTADFIQKWWSDKDIINFPVQVTCLEDGNAGPDYRAEAYALKKEAFQAKSITTGALKEYLVKHKIIGVGESFSNPEEKFVSYSNNYEQYIFAAKVSFTYDVEDSKNEMITYKGFKPFSKRFISAGEDKKYKFTFKLAAPKNIGLTIEHSAEFFIPGLPKTSAKRPFLANSNFVTKETIRKEKSIQTVDYK
jgi:hypothetical protein